MPRFDLVIRNAFLIDGSGAPGAAGEIAVKDGRIERMGDVGTAEAAREIDAGGNALAPGFIDVHTHDDRIVLSRPEVPAKVSQGVTTVVTGNCGISLAPFPRSRDVPPPLDIIAESTADLFTRMGDYLAALEAAPAAVNVAALSGHTTLRVGAMDRLDRAATGSEITAMRGALEKALDDGAIGLSTGLYYGPAAASSTAEVIGLAQPLRDHNAFYTTHLRDEADEIVAAMEEAFEIGRALEAHVILSHHKVTNPQNHGRTRETLQFIEKRSREQPLGLDVYPYAASSTILEKRRALEVDKILITWSKTRPEFAGRLLHEIAEELGVERGEAVDMLLPAGAVYFTMHEDDVQRVLSFPLAMVGSDGLPHDVRPHPRLWGTFPRVLGHYVRDVGLFGIEEAVRRMTSLPAGQFRLRDRGNLREGAIADMVLFDPETVLDCASFEAPVQAAKGILEVFTGGRSVWRGGKPTGERPGKALRLSPLGNTVQ